MVYIKHSLEHLGGEVFFCCDKAGQSKQMEVIIGDKYQSQFVSW